MAAGRAGHARGGPGVGLVEKRRIILPSYTFEIGRTVRDVEVGYESFDGYWEPFTLGVGPAGAYCASLEPKQREALREGCFRRLGSPAGPFPLTARAFAVRGTR